MNLREAVPLASLTTFRLGGPASLYADVMSADEVRAAIDLAHERALPIKVLGGGSNLLIGASGVHALVIHPVMSEVRIEDATLIADAGARWDDIVRAAEVAALWGIENLAGVPGTVGGAVVQNIGAYGAELKDVFLWADAIHKETGEIVRVSNETAAFEYRTSLFKREAQYVIVRAALALRTEPSPNIRYADLLRAQERGVPLDTPHAIAAAVRGIRAQKFPGPGEEGTAGSFFKNPVLDAAHAARLAEQYPVLPVFALTDGKAKIPLAWILDKALGLKGLSHGGARLYEKQPLVIVTNDTATATDVDALAGNVAARVYDATRITIEREVESFGAFQ